MDLQIREAINNSLATKVKSYCKNSPSEAIQPLLDLLGQQFVEKYLFYYKQVNHCFPSASVICFFLIGTTLSQLTVSGSMQYMFRGDEWFLEKLRSWKLLAGSQNLGSVFDKSRSLVFAWFVFTFSKSRNFYQRVSDSDFLLGSWRVSDFTIHHPYVCKYM